MAFIELEDTDRGRTFVNPKCISHLIHRPSGRCAIFFISQTVIEVNSSIDEVVAKIKEVELGDTLVIDSRHGKE